MSDPNKTVFISYRRDVSKYLALMIFKDLQQNGYDVFLDIEKIDSGSWESVIMNQIAARTHFVLLLTPGTLNRCIEPNDVLRQEIDHAMNLGRNIVPIFADKFELKTAGEFLVGSLSNLPKFNGMNLYDDMLDEGFLKLRERFLKIPVYSPTLIPAPSNELSQARQIIIETDKKSVPTPEELNAEQFFGSGYEKDEYGDLDGAIEDYSKAIKINPDYFEAYYNRGYAFIQKNKFDKAIKDFSKVIHLFPNDFFAYFNRGRAYAEKGDFETAIADYSQTIILNPSYANAYIYRADAYIEIGKLDQADLDYKKANDVLPKLADAINNFDFLLYDRGREYSKSGHYAKAIKDYTYTIKSLPNFAKSYLYRGEAHFATQHFDDALIDFKKASDLEPFFHSALAGQAITYHAKGNIKEAHRMWKILVQADIHYKDVSWVKQELDWAEPLVEEAKKLIAGL